MSSLNLRDRRQTGAPRVGLVGFGAIGRAVANSLAMDRDFSLIAICAREGQLEAARQLAPMSALVTTVGEALDLNPDIVVEAAGHRAVAEWGERALMEGCDLFSVSIGALADDALRARLSTSARVSGTQFRIPAGALAGFDGLLALRESGIDKVSYTSIKPAASWRGTPAEGVCDLSDLDGPTAVFEGCAGDAARLYPQNANLAAAVALAGIGFESTRVTLIADPHAETIRAVLSASGPSSSMRMEIEGVSAPGNPKSSDIVAASIVAALKNSRAAICFG